MTNTMRTNYSRSQDTMFPMPVKLLNARSLVLVAGPRNLSADDWSTRVYTLADLRSGERVEMTWLEVAAEIHAAYLAGAR